MIRDPTVNQDVDVPYDIATGSTVRRIRLPVPRSLRSAILALDETASDAAFVAITQQRVPPADALLTAAAGISPSPIVNGPAEFALALRLASMPKPSPIELVARERLTDPLAAAMVAEEPQVLAVAEAWAGWLHDGARSPWSAHIETARSELTDLFLAGRLRPAETASEGVPPWAMVGVVRLSIRSKIDGLLASPPDEATDLDAWIRTAQWWGEVRSASCADGPASRGTRGPGMGLVAPERPSFLRWLRTATAGS